MKKIGFILILLGMFLIFTGNINTKANVNLTTGTRTPICEPLPDCKLTPTDTITLTPENTETTIPTETVTNTVEPTTTKFPTETLTPISKSPTPTIVFTLTPTKTLVITLTPTITIKITPTPIISKTPVPSITSTQIQPPITNTPEQTEKVVRTNVPQLLPETGVDKTVPFNITMTNLGLGFIGIGIVLFGLSLKRK